MVALTAELGPAERYRRWLAVRRGAARVVVGTRSAVFAPVERLGPGRGVGRRRRPARGAPRALPARPGRAGAAGARGRCGTARRRVRPDGRGAGAGRVGVGAGGRGRPGEPPRRGAAGHGDGRDREPARARPDRPRPGCRSSRSRRPGPRSPRAGRCWCRSRVPGTCRGWRARSAGRPPAAATAPGHWRCRAGDTRPRTGQAVPPVRGCRSAAGAAARSRRSAARCARPGGCAPAWSAPGGRPRSWDARSPGRRPDVGRQGAGAGRGARAARPRGGHARSGAGRRGRVRRGAAPRRLGDAVAARPAGGRGDPAALDGRGGAGGARVRRGTAGRVVVVADAALPPVQALVRWDPAWHAAAELAARTEVGLPPAVRMASVEGGPGVGGRRGPAGRGRLLGSDTLLDPRRSGRARRGPRSSGPSSWIPNRAPTRPHRPGNGRCCACPARRSRPRRRARRRRRAALGPQGVRRGTGAAGSARGGLTGAADRAVGPTWQNRQRPCRVAPDGVEVPRRSVAGRPAPAATASTEAPDRRTGPLVSKEIRARPARPALRRSGAAHLAAEVTTFDAELRRLVADLTDTMLEQGGAGLAAPQMASGLRVFTYDCDGFNGHLVNPEWEAVGDEEQFGPEGCLSIPGSRGTAAGTHVVAPGFDMHGEPARSRAARCSRAHPARGRPPRRRAVRRPARRRDAQGGDGRDPPAEWFGAPPVGEGQPAPRSKVR